MASGSFQGWIASLSNGETVHELPMLDGQLSPWQALLRRLREEDLQITMLRLQRAGATLIAIPGARGYLQCTEVFKDLQTGAERSRQGIGSVFGETVVMTWIDNSRNIWADLRPLKDLRVHSTLQS